MLAGGYYGRRRVVQALMERQDYEQSLEHFDPSVWYSVNLNAVQCSHLRSRFVQLTYDKETMDFIVQSKAISDSVLWQLYYSVVSSLLQYVLTKTSINGILNRGSMFLFSGAHIAAFLDLKEFGVPEAIFGNLLDLGAGDGAITQHFSHLFRAVHVTELSSPMTYRLSSRGFHVLDDCDEWAKNDVKYDLIMCLNLIDRHERPKTLLKNLHSTLQRSGPDSRLLLAVVLPFSQFVEFKLPKGVESVDAEKSTNDAQNEQSNINQPSETLLFTCSKNSFEVQLQHFVDFVLTPAGFEVLKWSKLPYLCEGDLYRPFYELSDAVFLLKASADT